MSSVRHIVEDDASPADATLDAARASILAVGWKRVTLTEVARRAGVSRMTLYRRWPDMRALLGDLMTREWGALLDAMSIDDGPMPEAIAAAVVTLVRRLREDELFRRILDVDPELLLPYLLDRRGRSQQLVLDAVLPALRAGQRRGEVRRGSPDALARGLLLAGHGFVLSAATMVDERVSARTLDRELEALVLRYLRP